MHLAGGTSNQLKRLRSPAERKISRPVGDRARATAILASSRAASKNTFVESWTFFFFLWPLVYMPSYLSYFYPSSAAPLATRGPGAGRISHHVALDVHDAVDHTKHNTHSSAYLCDIPDSLTVIHPDCTNVNIGIP
jgi:hypothetical protein